MHTYHVSQICYALFQSCFVIRQCEPSALPFQTNAVISGERGREKCYNWSFWFSETLEHFSRSCYSVLCVSLSFLNGSPETQWWPERGGRALMYLHGRVLEQQCKRPSGEETASAAHILSSLLRSAIHPSTSKLLHTHSSSFIAHNCLNDRQ